MLLKNKLTFHSVPFGRKAGKLGTPLPSLSAYDLVIGSSASSEWEASAGISSIVATTPPLDFRGGRKTPFSRFSPARSFYTRNHVGGGATINNTPNSVTLLTDNPYSPNGEAYEVDCLNFSGSQWCALSCIERLVDISIGEWHSMSFYALVTSGTPLFGVRLTSGGTTNANNAFIDPVTGVTTIHPDFTEGENMRIASEVIQQTASGTLYWIEFSYRAISAHLSSVGFLRPVVGNACVAQVFGMQRSRGAYPPLYWFPHSGANQVESTTNPFSADLIADTGNIFGTDQGFFYLDLLRVRPNWGQTGADNQMITIAKDAWNDQAIGLNYAKGSGDGENLSAALMSVVFWYDTALSVSLTLNDWVVDGRNQVLFNWNSAGVDVWHNGSFLGTLVGPGGEGPEKFTRLLWGQVAETIPETEWLCMQGGNQKLTQGEAQLLTTQA